MKTFYIVDMYMQMENLYQLLFFVTNFSKIPHCENGNENWGKIGEIYWSCSNVIAFAM